MFKNIINWIKCRIDHDWTCAAEEGIPASQEQIDALIDGFFDYAKMYCKRCGHVYKR